MTAAELIAKLRAHPKTCGAIVVDIDDDYYEDGSGEVAVAVDGDSHEEIEGNERKILLLIHGALLLECVKRNICLPVLWREGWTNSDAALTNPKRATFYPTVLDAMLAGIEAATKEAGHG